jgi:hypothetical protein
VPEPEPEARSASPKPQARSPKPEARREAEAFIGSDTIARMSRAPVQLAAKLVRLLTSFHRASLDVPDGLFARDCVFRLNGISYQQALGRPDGDPLGRMLGRGPAAYRLLAQRIRYLMPDATVCVEDLQGEESPGLVTGIGSLTGTPRGCSAPVVTSFDVAFVTDRGGQIVEVGIQGGDIPRGLGEPGSGREPT